MSGQPNPDIFALAVAAAAHVGGARALPLYDLALDDPSGDAEVPPSHAENMLQTVGVRVFWYVADRKGLPNMLVDAARCGRWVALWVTDPLGSGAARWGLLDACHDHEPRLLYWRDIAAKPLEEPMANLSWLGHALVMPDGPLPPSHADRGMPALN